MKNIIFYHANCLDGTMSAALVINTIAASSVTYPITHGMTAKDINNAIEYEIQNNLEGPMCVWFLDYFPTKDMIENVKLDGIDTLNIIDHHQINDRSEVAKRKFTTDYPELKLNILFNVNYCGALNTFNFLNTEHHDSLPKHLNDIIMPVLLRVNDRDLWLKKYPDTDYIVKALWLKMDNEKHDSELIDFVGNVIRSNKGGNLLIDDLYNEGEIVAKYHNKLKKDLYQNNVTFKNISYDLIYPDNKTVETKDKVIEISRINVSKSFVSDLSSDILEDYPDIQLVVNTRTDNDQIVLDFRSREKGINCAELAERLGGGGHPGAAGVHFKDSLNDILYNPVIDALLN